MPGLGPVVLAGAHDEFPFISQPLSTQPPKLTPPLHQNGGHCQPFLYASPPSPARFELATYTFLRTFVLQNNVPCDWTDVRGVHAFLTQPLWSDVHRAVSDAKTRHPGLLSTVELVSDKARLAELHVPGACGAIVQQCAASLWPYKLVVWVLEGLVGRYGGEGGGFNLQTGTAVTGVRQGGEGDGWVVKTARGDVRARRVLLATNGYTSCLVEGMKDLVVPVRGQVGALVPPLTASTGTAAEQEGKGGRVDVSDRHSYCFFAEGEGDAIKRDEYLIQRPQGAPGEGYLILGGARSLAHNRAVGVWRDDEVEPDVAAFLRQNLIPPLDLSSSSSTPTTPTELKADYEWTGIMGYSRDGCPWVGPVSASLGGGEGLFVAAGYSGHGMPNAALAAHALVRAIRGENLGDGEKGEVDGVEYTMPLEFLVTGERVERARRGATVRELDLRGFGAEFAMLGRV